MKIFGKEIEERSYVSEIMQSFDLGKFAILIGRIIGKRLFRNFLFFHLKDQSGIMQVIFSRDVEHKEAFFIGERFRTGDIVAVQGECYLTKTKEKSLLVHKCLVLNPSQSLSFVGLKKTKRSSLYEARHMELSVNQEKFHYYAICSRLIFQIRQALYGRGFLEFDSGILQSRLEGGFADPFETHCKALNKKLYLRSTGEIRLKQIIASGYEKIFEIGKLFRNEGFSSKSSPEFTLLDCYWVFHDYNDMMNLFEEVVQEAILKSFNTYNPDRVSNLLKPWKKVSFRQLLQEMLNEEISSFHDKDSLTKILLRHGTQSFTCKTEGQMIRKIFGSIMIPRIRFPTYITEIPLVALPLAKASLRNEEVSEGAILAIDGMFVGDTYTDENNPVIMQKRLSDQSKKTGKPINEHFIDLLRFGIPLSAGFGLAINRLLLIFRGNWEKDIRETFIFPPLD